VPPGVRVLMVDSDYIILVLLLSRCHVLLLMLLLSNMYRNQIPVRISRQIRCLCWMLAQITSSRFTCTAKNRDGTTDFTRTIHFGLPTDLEREIYTRLLKGMLAIEATSFPEGTSGNSCSYTF
jgi:hypothetical protein